ncbi:hypothetical protein [Kitasatospora sp. NPDC087314]|uniref:hypothetical protein n=1 Tax=Kitasatospora sp. NPDC087314 TaxID=3364068 RepID=UPI0037F40298
MSTMQAGMSRDAGGLPVRCLLVLSMFLTLAGCASDPPHDKPDDDQVPHGRPVLLAFLDPMTGQSRSQVTVLRSMGTQFGERVAVAIVDVTGKADPNLRHDWNLDSARVTVLVPKHPADMARSYNASTPPTTLLIAADGRVLHRWSATVAHAQDIAPFLQSLSNPTPLKSK